MINRIDGFINNLASYVIKKNTNADKIAEKLKKIDEAFDQIDWEGYEEFLTHKYNRDIEYSGGCRGIRLKNEDSVAVQDAHMDKGVEFDWHHHDSKEILIIYRGRLKNINNGGGEYGVGDVVTIEQGSSHKAIALEDTDLIGIVIPTEEGYP